MLSQPYGTVMYFLGLTACPRMEVGIVDVHLL